MAKYSSLVEYLDGLGVSEVSVSFAQIGQQLDGGLPPSAYQHRAWWSNDADSHTHSVAWVAAGWRTSEVDMDAQTVTFRRGSAAADEQPASSLDGDGLAVRYSLLTQTMFDVLREQSAPIRNRDVLVQIREHIDLNEDELSLNQSNQTRADTFIGFVSGWAARLGLIDKASEGWTLTSHGRKFLDQTAPEDLYRQVNSEYRKLTAKPQTRAWLVRGNNVRGRNLVPRWLREGVVSLAASSLREVRPDLTRDELKMIVDEDYAHASYSTRGEKVDELLFFLTTMQPGHLIVTVDKGHLFIGTITGEPIYAPSPENDSNLTRAVEWASDQGIALEELPSELATRLKVQRDVLDLTGQLEWIEELRDAEIKDTPLPRPERVVLPPITHEMADRLNLPHAWLQECVELLNDRKQLIFYGPPGTGKTYLARKLAEYLATDRVRLVQFHPAYSYEDFFEGYRPTADGKFELTPGPMRRIADQAIENPEQAFILIIDEINRGNLARVFGELYFLLEYRGDTINLLYGDGDFSLPSNVFIIGTMNTADRSIALVDAAMRRRFSFVQLHPSEPPIDGLLRRWLDANELSPAVADIHEALNARIEDADFKIGPSYFMRPEVHKEGGLERMWRTSILPLLEEHHYGELDAAEVRAVYGYDAIRSSLEARALGQPVSETEDATPRTN